MKNLARNILVAVLVAAAAPSIALDDQGTATITVNRQVRTWRTNIESAYGTVPSVTAFRETLQINEADQTVLSKVPSGQIQRSFSDAVANGDKVTLSDGTVLSIAQMAEAIPVFIELWAAQDAAAPKPANQPN